MRNKQDKCFIEGCKRQWKAHEWCLMHYKRWWRHGHPLYGTPEFRFWKNVKKSKECWAWLGKSRVGKSGLYGQFSINNKSVSVHRFSYELANGKFDKSLHVLHKCDNPICVNPKHLWLGTNLDNIRDKMKKGRWNGGRPKKKL